MNKAFAVLFLLVLGLMMQADGAPPAQQQPTGTHTNTPAAGGVRTGGASAVTPAAAAANAAAGIPTTQELQAKLDAKDYDDVIKEVSRVLRMKGPAVKSLDKYDYLMLRGEASLQKKQQSPAISAYQDAAKETSDPTKAGVAKAMVKLLQQSKGFQFTPKPSSDPTHPATPLNILDQNDRKLALTALFDDEWKPAQAKIDQLKKRGTSLPPIIEAADLAGQMRGLEIAATGSDTQTSTALSDLTDSAAKLMNDYLDAKTKRVDDIDRMANMTIGSTINDTQRRGLTGAQISELKEVISTCGKLTLAAQAVEKSAGPKAGDFKTIADKSTELGKRADTTLNADYSEYIDPNNNRGIVRPGEQSQQPVRGPRGYPVQVK